MLKWKRIDNDNTQQTTLTSGRMFKVAKQYNHNCEHKGEWQLWEYDASRDEWEWCETYSPMWYAKEQVLNIETYEQA